MNLEIANRLALLRREKGYSQEGLARELGVSRQAVSKWERGEAAPEMEHLILLAGLFEVSLDTLLLGAGGSAQTQAAPEPQAPEEDPEDEDALFEAAARWEEIAADARREKWSRWRKRLLVFPFPVLVTGIFLLMGFGLGWWHPGWIIYLTIPVYYCLVGGSEH